MTALGGFATTAITALTAQNTTGVYGVVPVEPNFIEQQMRLVLDDIGADCLKTGMLHSSKVIETVVDVLADIAPDLPLVADPVMFAKGGHALLEPEAMDALRGRLVPRAHVVTPNIPEAEALAEMKIAGVEDMKAAGEVIRALGAAAVLVKGGHLEDETLTDVLVTSDGVELFNDQRIDTKHTHGTGCVGVFARGGIGCRHGHDRSRATRPRLCARCDTGRTWLWVGTRPDGPWPSVTPRLSSSGALYVECN